MPSPTHTWAQKKQLKAENELQVRRPPDGSLAVRQLICGCHRSRSSSADLSRLMPGVCLVAPCTSRAALLLPSSRLHGNLQSYLARHSPGRLLEQRLSPERKAMNRRRIVGRQKSERVREEREREKYNLAFVDCDCNFSLSLPS